MLEADPPAIAIPRQPRLPLQGTSGQVDDHEVLSIHLERLSK